MPKSEELQSRGLGPVFHGPINGPVLINSTWQAAGNEQSKTERHVKIPTIEYEDELDADVEVSSPEAYEDHRATPDIYPITAHPKGRILILNNEFKNAKIKRRGSLADVANMMTLWQSLGFAVEIVSDLTSEGMQQTVRDFVMSEGMRKVNICAILVMSHGESDDFIVGEQHTRLSVMNIVEEVKKSKILDGKPKLLFFQMCRGKKVEKAETTPGLPKIQSDSIAFTGDPDQPDSKWFKNMLDTLLPKTRRMDSLPDMPQKRSSSFNPTPTRFNNSRGRIESGTPRAVGRQIESDTSYMSERGQSDQNNRRNVESDANAVDYTDRGGEDIMIAFATQPDHVSFRGHNGSWFVSAIAHQFKLHAKDHDLIELMNLVKDEVCKMRSNSPTTRPKYHNCVAAVEASDSFLGKKLFFFPGYPNTFK